MFIPKACAPIKWQCHLHDAVDPIRNKQLGKPRVTQVGYFQQKAEERKRVKFSLGTEFLCSHNDPGQMQQATASQFLQSGFPCYALLFSGLCLGCPMALAITVGKPYLWLHDAQTLAQKLIQTKLGYSTP